MQATNLANNQNIINQLNCSPEITCNHHETHQSCDLMPARKENQDLTGGKASIPASGQWSFRSFLWSIIMFGSGIVRSKLLHEQNSFVCIFVTLFVELHAFGW